MKVTGVIRRIDDLGRICIPKEVRSMANLNVGDAMEIFYDKKEICLKKYSTNQNIGSNILDVIEESDADLTDEQLLILNSIRKLALELYNNM